MPGASRASLHNPGRPVHLTLGGLELEGFSISGLSTYVRVPAFDVCFDLGHCSIAASHTRNILLSHVHQDHLLGVIRYLSLREMTGARPGRVYLPTESRDDFVAVLEAFARMERRPLVDVEKIVRGVEPGAHLALSNRLRVEAFDVVHRVPSRGFTVFEQRKRLLPQFVGVPGEALQAAHTRGEELYERWEANALTYVGDSTLETLELHPEVGRSEVLILEATHLPGTSPERSAKYGHTHLEELAAFHGRRPEALASPHVVLKHFSMKYDKEQILRAKEVLPPELRARVTLMV